MKIRIVVCDSSRMRYFAKDQDSGVLHEIADRVHEASRQRIQDIASDRPGRDRGRDGGSGAHSLNDNREVHSHTVGLFAREVAEVLNSDALAGEIIRLYILAPPEFLGMLRKELHPVTAALTTDKAVNVVEESLDKIRRQLPAAL